MKKYRIFLVIGGKATPGDNNNMWVKNLYDPLVALRHDVYLLNIDEYAQKHGLGYMSPQARERLSNELPDIFLKEHTLKPFDIFFSYLHNVQIEPDVLLEIKKHVYTINYSTNYHQFEIYRNVALNVDFNIYISKMAKSSFDDLGVKSYWMPLAGNPHFYKPAVIKNKDVVFIGSVYGNRSYLFWRLLQYGVNLHLYGQSWKLNEADKRSSVNVSSIKGLLNNFLSSFTGYKLINAKHHSLSDTIQRNYASLNATILDIMRNDYPTNLHCSLSDKDYVNTLAQADIVVNIQESRYNHDFNNPNVLFGSNLRDFETTMCGSFLTTQYSTEIEELFEIGKEIICYHNEHDLYDKIKFYTQNDSAKLKIAKAGYIRSLNSHTWEKRFSDFFEYLNL